MWVIAGAAGCGWVVAEGAVCMGGWIAKGAGCVVKGAGESGGVP